ncbi:hypothetical protein ATE77_14065 [Sphingopyxis sp. H005]|nr:hypothetical protein ATE77_14065 [Sphingopyxis sp. H005]
MAMQSSVRPLHGALFWDFLIPIISAHSSLIAAANAVSADGSAGAEANAVSCARRPSKAPTRSRKVSQRFTVEA